MLENIINLTRNKHSGHVLESHQIFGKSGEAGEAGVGFAGRTRSEVVGSLKGLLTRAKATDVRIVTELTDGYKNSAELLDPQELEDIVTGLRDEVLGMNITINK